jgi:integrase
MSLYKRRNHWWFKIKFQGALIRESARTTSKNIAREAERARRRELELAANGLLPREKPLLFSLAADRWFESKTALTPLGKAYYRQYIGKLKRHFSNRLVSDITSDDIAALQRKRQAQGLSGRQTNCEVATLRTILKKHRRWSDIAPDVTMLPEREDTGRAISPEHEEPLLDAIGQSISPSLYPFFILSLDGGLRPAEIRALRRGNLNLTWNDGVISEGAIIVGSSKTAGGRGREVPLTRRACGALTLWLSRFPQAAPESYLFPFHHVGFAGDNRKPHLWGIDLNRPMGTHSYKRAYDTARQRAGFDYRLYDARHTFITRLAENPVVSEETIRQLAGHVSQKMLSRYAHIRQAARRAAIAAIEVTAISGKEGAQKGAQYDESERVKLN